MPPSPQEDALELAQLLKGVSSTLARDARILDATSKQLLDTSNGPSCTAARSTIRELQDCLGPLMQCAVEVKNQQAQIQKLLSEADQRHRS